MERHHLDAGSAAIFAVAFVAAAFGTRSKPSVGIATMLFFDPFDFAHDISRTTVTLPKILLLGVLTGLLVRRSRWSALWAPETRGLSIAAVALLAANALTIVPSEYIDTVARETLKALQYALAFAACVVAIREDPDERPLRFALALSVSLVALLALAQEFSGAPAAVSIAGRVMQRIAGPLEGPNQLAGYFGIVIPILLAYAVALKDRLAAAVAALAFFALVLTLSRAGIAAGVVGIAVLMTVMRGVSARAAFGGGAAIVALGAAGLAATGGFARFVSLGEVGAPTGLATRWQLWTAAIDLWKRSPWLGIGAGNYELELPSVGLPTVRTHANSIYLQALAEGGIPLLAATLWAVYASIATFARARSRDPLVLGVLAASCGLALHQIFDCMTFFPKVGAFWWIVMGAAVARIIVSREQSAGMERAQE
ncbi:MAG: O-antigen ligase family protein [Candidatus Eremiobacteraeota bacterium]|nr:O-antigen ligase family protein [Candidatus Eremiobacteraeota bacterium]